MKLTTKGRFAVTAMLDLALNEKNMPIKLSEISQRQSISLSYLEQLFSKLRKNNIVKSIRGPGGGYLLNSPKDEISVAHIINAVNESIELSRCDGRANCHDGKQCLTHNLWVDLSLRINEFFKAGIIIVVLLFSTQSIFVAIFAVYFGLEIKLYVKIHSQ